MISKHPSKQTMQLLNMQYCFFVDCNKLVLASNQYCVYCDTCKYLMINKNENDEPLEQDLDPSRMNLYYNENDPNQQYIQSQKDQNNDGMNDFQDVKIARMLASGMSLEQIKKEHPDLFKRQKQQEGSCTEA